MLFARAQTILKTVLPQSYFDSLYNTACNWFDVYQSILDTIYYRLPTRDKAESTRRRVLRTVKPYTMTSRVGLLATYDSTKRAVRGQIDGSFVECGVARGGCSALMALVAREENTGRKTWLFDSFEGLPEQSEADGVQKPVRHKDRTANDLAKGYCLGAYAEVTDWLYLDLGLRNIELVKGWFQDTLPEYRLKVGKIAVLRLDGDWYESTKCCLENLYDNVVTGGHVIIDDYQLPGCRKAVDDFLLENAPHTVMTFDRNGRSYFRKWIGK